MKDFFSQQDAARRNTRRLVVLFVLAVAAIVAAVYFTVLVVLFANDLRSADGGTVLFHPGLFFPVAAATLLVIAGGSLFKTVQLSEGGSAVGRLLGGRPLDPNTSDAVERRVLNVVEEMSIAAGTPVPEVYLLDRERSINAFAAGRTPSDAVIGITRGTAELLSRDELQGVVAHEVSHVLNGDMRLNLRLMGVVHGILVISTVGYMVMRGGGMGRVRRGKGGGAAAIALLGVALFLIGWIGVFFGRLIKAGISRQREYLADAAAVQFTRNPWGLGGALKKIGGYGAGSRILERHAEEASHLFFSDALKSTFLGITATHPPLDERIRRIDPSFDGTYPKVEWPAEGRAPAGEEERSAGGPRAGLPGLPGVEIPGADIPGVGTILAGGVLASGAPEAVADSVGTLDPPHVEHAAALLAALPEPLREAAHEPASARALVFALLLDPERAVRVRQLEVLRESAEPELVEEARRLAVPLAEGPPEARIPLLDLALPALRRMSSEQYQDFRSSTEALAHADGRISLFEYALHRMLLRHLDPRFGRPRKSAVQYYSLKKLGSEVSCLLALLARAGARDEAAAGESFAAGLRELGDGKDAPEGVELPDRESCGLDQFDRALSALALAAPRLKERLLRGAVAAVVHDGRITSAEGELVRAVADTLDCPVPPFLRAPAAASSGQRT